MQGALLKRITLNPKVMVGKPTIRGLRITVEQILRALAGGVPVEDLFRDYPELEQADIQACLAYGAERVAEERVYPIGATKRAAQNHGRNRRVQGGRGVALKGRA